jgi:hypothetical protein
MYADATFAGLSVLVPLPLLDWMLEQFFRRRMVRTITRRYGRVLSPEVHAELLTGQRSCVASCIGLFISGTIGLIKRVSRKLLYFLTVKDASDQLSFYWQRAFLLRHMLEAGHLESPATARLARQAMEQVLERSSSPLRGLAQQVVAGARRVLSTLLRARRGRENDVVRQTEARMRGDWDSFAAYLTNLASHYDQTYHEMLAQGSGVAARADHP